MRLLNLHLIPNPFLQTSKYLEDGKGDSASVNQLEQKS